jgi:hypothetical protein
MDDNFRNDAYPEAVSVKKSSIAGADVMYIIDDMWRGLKKYFWVIPILMLLCSVGSYFVTKASFTPRYQAYSSFAVNTRTAYGYTSTYYNKAVTTQMAKTFPYILTSGTLQNLVKEDLGVSKYKMRPEIVYYNPLDGDPATWVNGQPPKPQPVIPEPVVPEVPAVPAVPEVPAESSGAQ